MTEGRGYVHGYGTASATMATRTAENFAAFFIPYLSSQMKLLDVGCGPGTITVGLATRVNRGQLVGVDPGQSEVDKAILLAGSKGLMNARFRTADATRLPFADSQFDAVFSSATLEHVPEAPKAVQEMHRVLRPGGVIGLKGGMVSSSIHIPEPTPHVQRAMEVYLAVWSSRGGHPRMGVEQVGLLRDAGFADLRISGALESRPMRRDYSEWFKSEAFIRQAEAIGAATRAEIDTLARGIAEAEQRPGAMSLVAWVEVVARKQSRR